MRRRRGEQYSPEVDLPIAPMLDMVFQILTFFIMTYHPSNLEGQFPINLAATEHQGGQQEEKLKPDVTPSPRLTPDPAPVTVIAKASTRGLIESLEVTTLAGTKEVIRETDGTTALPNLERKLREIKQEQDRIGKKDERLVLRASSTLRWEEMMKLMDACREGKGRKKLFPKIEMDMLR